MRSSQIRNQLTIAGALILLAELPRHLARKVQMVPQSVVQRRECYPIVYVFAVQQNLRCKSGNC